MQHSFINIILSLLLLIIYSLSSSQCEELESISSISKISKKSELTLNLTDITGKPAIALLQINKINSDKKLSTIDKWSVINNNKTLKLLPGNYNCIINGGLRRVHQIFNILLTPGENKTQQLIMKPYAPVEPAGWIMIDPLFINSDDVNNINIKQKAQAQEIRVVFANYISIDSLNCKKSNNLLKTILAPVKKNLHPSYGLYYSFFSNNKNTTETQYLNTPLFRKLIQEKDNNNLTLLSPLIFDKKINQQKFLLANEFIFDTIAGPLYDILLLPDFNHSLKIWYTLLNQGYRIPGIFSPLTSTKSTIPQTKLYVKLPRRNYTLKMLNNSLKKGESIISNGPFIRFFVENINTENTQKNNDWINGNSSKIGGVVFTSESSRNVFAEAYTCSDPTDIISHIDLIYNGKIIKSIKAKSEQKSLQTNFKIKLPEKGWLQLRYYSHNSHYFALTNPIYITDSKHQKPEPAISKTQIKVIDDITNRAIPAKILISNFDTIINSFNISDHPVIIQAPATADIIVEAKGYKTLKKNIYIDGSSADYIMMLLKKNLLERAQENPVTYKYLRKALLNSKLIFRLKKK